jgi:hypothetical protein
MAEKTGRELPSPGMRVAISLGVPLIGAVLLSTTIAMFATGRVTDPTGRAGTALLLGGVGIISWLLGTFWYGRAEMGVRGGRPLYAGIGFAVLGWVGLLVARVILVNSNPDELVSADIGRTYLYLLIFEGFCIQAWAFGLVFRSMVDLRGGITAAATSGILYGMLASQLFQEAFIGGLTAVLFFGAWGVFYGIIRLRTGSWVGLVIVQSLQTITIWHILLPQSPPVAEQLQNFYLAGGILFVIFIWRLWPTEEEDYRV